MRLTDSVVVSTEVPDPDFLENFARGLRLSVVWTISAEVPIPISATTTCLPLVVDPRKLPNRMTQWTKTKSRAIIFKTNDLFES